MRTTLALLAALLLAGPAALAGQVRPEGQGFPRTDGQEMAADSLMVRPGADLSPLGAFLRAVALPAWGHSAIGSYRRGAFYTVAEAGTIWMLLKTASRRSAARRTVAEREAVVRAQVILDNPGAANLDQLVEDALEADPLVADARGLVIAREGQFEDWVAMGIFLTFLSGADAFVSQHLRDFPDPIELNVSSTPDGGVEVGARVFVGGRGPVRRGR
jgi:hypothetical protein